MSSETRWNESLKDQAIEVLQDLREADLQSRVIEPLLRCLGYQHVRDTSGPQERGKDLIATKTEFGRSKLYAIQIKRQRFSGKHNSPNALVNVVNQLLQAFSEPVIDPKTNTERVPDRGLFITPYPLKTSVLESAHKFLREKLERRDITIIDGNLLLDAILESMPGILPQLNGDIEYRIHVARTANMIKEATAFGKRKLQVDELYVGVGMDLAARAIGRLVRFEPISSPPLLVALTKQYLGHFDRLASRREVDAQIVESCTGKKKKVVIAAPDEGRFHDLAGLYKTRNDRNELEVMLVANHSIVEVELGQLFRSLHSSVWGLLEDIASSNADAAVGSGLDKLVEMTDEIEEIFSDDVVGLGWDATRTRPRKKSSIPAIPASALARTKHHIVVTGKPGGGKTTLMRRLATRHATERPGTAPVLCELVGVQGTTAHSIRSSILELLISARRRISEKAFGEALARGEYVLYLDGLDETRNPKAVLEAIIELSDDFPKAQMLVSCREAVYQSLGIDWRRALHVRLNDFSHDELDAFIGNWFKAEPSAATELRAWLVDNPKMRDVASTPIVAALLCTLNEAHAELPTTMVKLYERRLELLLGDWERAKGMAALDENLRKQYRLFLMRLAVRLHESGDRVMPWKKAHRMAIEDFQKGAMAVLNDCVNRGLLQRDGDRISFGHLTYQEHLVGTWLAHENDLETIIRMLGDPKWRVALEFYAELKGDISALVKRVNHEGRYIPGFDFMSNLLRCAPFTREVLLQ